MNRKNKLIAKHNALGAERDLILAISPSERTTEQTARLAQIMGEHNAATGAYEGGEMASVQMELGELEAAEFADKNASRFASTGTDAAGAVASNAGPRPAADVQTVHVHATPGFATFGAQLKAIVQSSQPGAQVDPRLIELQNQESQLLAASGASEAIPQDGGFVVQRDFTTELLARATAASQLAPRCRTMQIAGSGLDAPIVDETSRASGSRWGGVQVYRNHEAEAVTAAKPKFGKMKMDLEDLSGLAYATDNLLQDAPAMEGLFSIAFTEEFAFKIDNEILDGTGAGEMLGILKAPALVTVAKETSQAADTIVWENIIKMWARVHPRSMPNIIWTINNDCLPQLMQMSKVVGTGGVPVWLPPGGAADAPHSTLIGRPVIPLEQSKTLGDLGDITAVDLSQYLIIEKAGGIQSAQSMHVRFIQHEMTFRWKVRNNGQPMWPTALTPANGTNTLSPFVALAARA